MRLHYSWITFTNFVTSYLPKTHFGHHFIINETIAWGEALLRSWLGSWPHSAAFGDCPDWQGSKEVKKWQAHIDTWCQQLLPRSSLQGINIKGRGSYCACFLRRLPKFIFRLMRKAWLSLWVPTKGRLCHSLGDIGGIGVFAVAMSISKTHIHSGGYSFRASSVLHGN